MFNDYRNVPGIGLQHVYLCGLCGNTGWIDTVGKVHSPAGVECGIRAPCLCLNGRSILKQIRKSEPKQPRKPKLPTDRQRFWMSWRERGEQFPKKKRNEAILEVWCSGYAGDGSYATMVAWVEAASEKEAKAIILKDWGGKRREWRFITEVERDWRPSDRFQLTPEGTARLQHSERAG
jgi:hypothetical protein